MCPRSRAPTRTARRSRGPLCRAFSLRQGPGPDLAASLRRASNGFEGHRDRAAAAQAEGREPVAAFAATELVKQRGDDAGTARTDRVPERDRAAVDVDAVPVEPELAAVGEDLGGERLVDPDEVEGLKRHLDSVEQLPDALDRRQEEPAWRDLGLGVSDNSGEWLEPVALHGPLADDDGCGRAVGDARGIARG